MEFFVAFIHFSLPGKENKSALVVGKLYCGFQREGIKPGTERNGTERNGTKPEGIVVQYGR